MLGVLAPWVVLLQAASPPPADNARVLVAAESSSRPPECRPAAQPDSAIWRRARSRALEFYCAELAKGHARLESSPDSALKSAINAARAVPGRRAPLVLRGRAELRLGRVSDAVESLSAAEKLGDDTFGDPAALHDYAIALLRVARFEEALSRYRILVTRVALLDDIRDRQIVQLEAAALALSRGPEGVSEAIGYLTESRRKGGVPGLSDLATGLFALALDRDGRVAQARAIAREASGPWELERWLDEGAKSAGLPVLPQGELAAVVAIVAEHHDPKLAETRWQTYLAGPPITQAWASHAKQKLEKSSSASRASSRKGR